MSYAIVFSSRTGNTQQLADQIHQVLGSDDCVYYGDPSLQALSAERIYVGFWTDKGTCNKEISQFLKSLSTQEVFLFGTAGFGGNISYYEKILHRVSKNLSKHTKLVGHYMCQGKMPLSVRERYEKMLSRPIHIPRLKTMIANFDSALSHPDPSDLAALRQIIISV